MLTITRRFVFAALALALVAGNSSSPATAGDYDFEKFLNRKSAWTGHGIGSVVKRKTTQDMKIPQMPGGGRKTVTEETETLVEITETEYVIKVESKTMMGPKTSKRREPKVIKIDPKKAKITDGGEDTLTIGGKPYPCKKKKVGNMTELMAGMGAEQKGRGGQKIPVGTGVVWVHATEGVLQLKVMMSAMGQKIENTMTATKLKATHKVGEKTYSCREFTMTNSMGMKQDMLQDMSVPGATVLKTSKMAMQGFSMDTRTELLSYVKKALTPVTTTK